MKKQDIELIISGISINNEEVIKMKIYKEGVILRQGCGSIPVINVLGMSEFENSDIFNTLINHIPEEALSQLINYQEENIDESLLYYIAFYGGRKNNERGEKAEFENSTGIRFLLSNTTTFNHPALQFIDSFCIGASHLTDSWYFDILIAMQFNLQSTRLPEHSIVSSPELDNIWEIYLQHMAKEKGINRLNELSNEKLYIDKNSGTHFSLTFTAKDNALSYNFKEKAEIKIPTIKAEEKNKKKWWKF